MSGCALQIAGFRPARVPADRQPLDRRRGARLRCRGDDRARNLSASTRRRTGSTISSWGTFCDWYLEFTKPILQGEDAAARAETQATTAWVLAQLVHLLHPVMPFITEELWRAARRRAMPGMLIRADWPDLPPDLHDPDAAAEMEWVVAAISAIRAIRTEVNVPAGRARAAAGQGCRRRCDRSGSNATASTFSASPGSSGSSRSRPCRRAGSRRSSRARR